MDLNDPTTVALLAAETLAALGREHALYGGLLTAVYGDPRETRDADMAVVDVSAAEMAGALRAAGIRADVAFENVIFGGLSLSRVTLLGAPGDTGLNTVDLVVPRSARYASLAVRRAVESTVRGAAIRLLALEDFIVFKVLSTRDRDLEDARAAAHRSRAALDLPLVDDEIAMLTTELPSVDVAERWRLVRRTLS
jgi:hypothetical protein